NVGDLIVDPFFGSGTTGAVAKKLKRNFIGFEREPFYIDVATRRIAQVVPIDRSLLEYRIEKRAPKVPFGALVEKGMVKIGEMLYSKDQKFSAQIQANASLLSGDKVGSIHKVSAALLGKENNNGWAFWYVWRDEKMVCIDDLRYQYEKQFLPANPTTLLAAETLVPISINSFLD
ncbi:MAG TPA: DNA methyltransferase, partial [Chitinophagales bacterium]|nr:DNA methyltransferase [Chitinophagales bacterium]